MNKKGFTLVELLLVIVILGIITALTMPEFISAISTSQKRKEEHLVTLIKQELDMLNKDVGEYDFWCGTNCGTTGETLDLIGTDYENKIKRDIDLDGCEIETLIIAEGGSHTVKLNCKD